MKRQDIPALRARTRLKAWKYIKRDTRGFDHGVNCKVCGAEIQGLVTVDSRKEKRGGQDVIVERQLMAQHANFAEVRIVFDDGSAHVTPLCRTCAHRIKPDDLAEIYAADLDEFQNSPGQDPWDRLEGRTPVRHEVLS